MLNRKRSILRSNLVACCLFGAGLASAQTKSARVPTGRKSAEKITAAARRFAKKEFGSDVEFSWVCNPKKNIYADDGNGSFAEVPTQQGCGTKYYQKDVSKVDGKFPVRIGCQCGANVRAFANLQRFRA